MTALRGLTNCIEIILFKLRVFPRSSAQHISSKLGLKLLSNWHVVWSLCNLVRLQWDCINKLTFLELIDNFLVVVVNISIIADFLEQKLFIIDKLSCNTLHLFLLFTTYLDPFSAHSLCETNLCNIFANLCLNFRLKNFHVNFKSWSILEFWGSFFCVSRTFIGENDRSFLNDLKNNILINKQWLKSSINLCSSLIILCDKIIWILDFAFFVKNRQESRF